MLTDNIIAYWKLDESSGDATDSSGNGYTLTNNNTVGYTTAKINNGADTGSSNSNKSLTRATDLGLNTHQTGTYSVSLWVNITTAPSSGNASALFGVRDSSKNQAEFVYSNDSGTYKVYNVIFNGSTVQTLVWTKTLTTGNWFHLVFVKNGTTVTFYVNGSSEGNNTITISNGTSGGSDAMALLKHPTVSGNYLSGLIDEVGVWSRALSSDEVTTLYNGGNGLTYPFTTTKIKKFNGVAYANIKKINGIEIAKVKKLNGLA